jgi:fructokinase
LFLAALGFFGRVGEMSLPNNGLVLVWGEVLWDCLPEGLFLGGAPFNVGFHLRQLGHPVEVVSAVGQDVLGEQIFQRADRAGVGRKFLAIDPARSTGWVEVELDEHRNAHYRIVENVAWDAIPAGTAVLAAAAQAAAIVYGSLAQRGEANRRNLTELLAATSGWRVMDVNLRPPFDDRDLVLALARKADLLKLNEEELKVLSRGGEDLEKNCRLLAGATGVSKICVTRGAEGAVYWTPGFVAQGRAEPVEVRDTVGAGDAFLAALVAEALRENLSHQESAAAALDRACQLGAYVATQRGATPKHEGARRVC